MGTKKAPGNLPRNDFRLSDVRTAHQRALGLFPRYRISEANFEDIHARLLAECPDPDAVLARYRDEKKGRKKHG